MRGLCTNWWLVYKSGKIKINLVRHLKNDYFQNSVSSSGKIGSANQHFCWELRKPDKNKAKNNHRAKDQNEDTWRTGCSLCNNSSPEARANSKGNMWHWEMEQSVSEPQEGGKSQRVRDPLPEGSLVTPCTWIGPQRDTPKSIRKEFKIIQPSQLHIISIPVNKLRWSMIGLLVTHN